MEEEQEVKVKKMGLFDVFKLMTMREKVGDKYKVMFASGFPMPLDLYHWWLLLTGKVQMFIAEGHYPLGMAYLDMRDTSKALFGIYVRERYRGCGAGSALLNAAIREAVKRDIELELTVFDWNSTAHDWYERNGFREYQKSVYMRRGKGV